MSQASLERALPDGKRILLDTSVLIAYLNGGDPVSPLAAHVVDELVRTGRNPALVSMVTVMEVLVRPLRLGPAAPYQHLLDFLTHFPHLEAGIIALPVAQEAASLRATYTPRPADALIVATGIVRQVAHLVTDDADWPRKLQPLARRIRVCRLSHHLPFP